MNPTELIEEAICRHEGILLANGAFSAHTGKYTGRSPKDKYFVRYVGCDLENTQHQWLSEEQFDCLFERITTRLDHVGGFVFDGSVNHHPLYPVPVRFYTEYAWHSLFVQSLFAAGDPGSDPLYTVYSAPSVKANPITDHTRSETFIVIHLARRIVLMGGTEYAGELKKSVFTLMHHHLPNQGVLPMHCSATVGHDQDVVLFFGLSGTGKTTLSADPRRMLIGDDEHGWGHDGVFNVENGCYAKCIDLSEEREPIIYRAIRYGAVLENVIHDASRQPIYRDRTLTENTRAAYPLNHVHNVAPQRRASHPKAIIFLSADATGILPCVARLNSQDAHKHFLLGYTSKLAGTERGVVVPEPTFSACFASPFLTYDPETYAHMFMDRVNQYNVPVYLLNTGWVGGGVGDTDRIPLTLSQEIVNRIIAGELDHLETIRDDSLFLNTPIMIPGIQEKFLNTSIGFKDESVYLERRAQLIDSFARELESFPTRIIS